MTARICLRSKIGFLKANGKVSWAQIIMEKPLKSTSAAKKPILLVDDHPIFRYGLEAFLKKHEPEFVCSHAETARAALESLRDSSPDIAIVDVSLVAPMASSWSHR